MYIHTHTHTYIHTHHMQGALGEQGSTVSNDEHIHTHKHTHIHTHIHTHTHTQTHTQTHNHHIPRIYTWLFCGYVWLFCGYIWLFLQTSLYVLHRHIPIHSPVGGLAKFNRISPCRHSQLKKKKLIRSLLSRTPPFISGAFSQRIRVLPPLSTGKNKLIRSLPSQSLCSQGSFSVEQSLAATLF